MIGCLTPRGVFHRIEKGQTLYTISRIYNVSLYDIMKANNIKDPEKIYPGEKIFIPNATRPRYVPSTINSQNNNDNNNKTINIKTKRPPENRKTAANSVKPKKRTVKKEKTLNSIYEKDENRIKSEIIKEKKTANRGGTVKLPPIPRKNKKPVKPELQNKKSTEKVETKPRKKFIAKKIEYAPDFIWPLKGRKIIPFGWRGSKHQDGIWIKAKKNTPVLAVDKGQVIYAKYLNNYGKTVIIKNSSKLVTVYAHNSKIYVKANQHVSKGQKIASSGPKGLYFSVMYHRIPVDPMKFLPKNR